MKSVSHSIKWLLSQKLRVWKIKEEDTVRLFTRQMEARNDMLLKLMTSRRSGYGSRRLVSKVLNWCVQ